jgi:hypothetical protein
VQSVPRISIHCSVSQVFVTLTALLLPVSAGSQTPPQIPTPLLLAVQDAPVPFSGSDGHVHLVYELWITNFTPSPATIEKVEILGDDVSLQRLDADAVAHRLQPAGLRESSGTMAKSTQSLLFLDIDLPPGAPIPHELLHRVDAQFTNAPPSHQEFHGSGGRTTLNRRPAVKISPPLQGGKYISADSCCDATRHTRAALAVNGRVWVAQRYAVDWEQLNAQDRIYAGPRENLESYTIFGKPVLAVADATVVSVTRGRPEQTPGHYPADIPLDQADGNSIVLDLGEHRYALYAHLQSESIQVNPGDHVKRGQVMAHVGDSGNSVAPHLHFQVMDTESSLAANGLPYEMDNYQIAGRSPGTEAFDEAEANGTPLAVIPVVPPRPITSTLPLDQLILTLQPH